MVLALRDRSVPVIVIDDLSSGFESAVPKDVTLVRGNVGDAELVERVLREAKVDAIAHFAASIVVPDSVSDPIGYYTNNTVRTTSLIGTAISAGVERFVFSSTAAVYGTPSTPQVDEESPTNPESPYGAAKLMSERKYLNQPEPVLQAVLTGKFDNGLGQTLDVPDRIKFDPYPWKSFATWISSQMVRWDLMPEEKAKYEEIADQVYMTDLARELAKELGQNPPAEATRVEKLKTGDFDPAKASEYVQEQIKKNGV